MALQLSTGAKRGVLDVGFRTKFADSILYMFSGTPPVNPDAAVGATNTLVARAAIDEAAWAVGTIAGNGISWELTDELGNMVAATVEDIEAVGQAEGTARWFWLIENNADVNGEGILSTSLLASTKIARVQGLVAVGGGDLSISNNAFTVGSTSPADSLRVRF